MLAAEPIAPSEGHYTPPGKEPVTGAPPWFRRRIDTRYWLFDLGPVEGEHEMCRSEGEGPYGMARCSEGAKMFDQYRVANARLFEGMYPKHWVKPVAMKYGPAPEDDEGPTLH